MLRFLRKSVKAGAFTRNTHCMISHEACRTAI